VKRWPVVGLALAVLWLFVRGVALEAGAIAGEFLIGLAVGLSTAFVLRRFYSVDIAIGGALRSVPAATTYLVLFVYELVTANVEVAYRVLAPSLPIEPAVIELPLRVQSDLAITTIANSITLTPGTLTMDYDEETNALYVHALAGRDTETIVAPIRRWEDYALRIFDEPLDPSATVVEARRLRAESEAAEASDARDAAGGETDG
jgi:multicomponent Na+:H+ antiporter subunit E